MGATPQFGGPVLAQKQDPPGPIDRRNPDAEPTVTRTPAGAPDLAPHELPGLAANQILANRYRIVRFLGRGGMGEVYEAEDLELNVRVALKTLRPEIASDAHMVARFKHEIQLARQITHPNVCRIYDVSHHTSPGAPEVVFLTMELLEGETLADAGRRAGKISGEEALPLVRQMAEGLDAAHRAGIIHRDFKPSNVILVDEAGGPRAVITDFGLARRVRPHDDTLSGTGGLIGTIRYMAPEVLSGNGATAASDIYALGLVIYQLVTGTLPFPEETPLAGAIRRTRSPVPAPTAVTPDLSPRWEEAILKCLRPDPEERFASAGLVYEAIREADRAARGRRWTRRRVSLAAGLAVAAGAALWFGPGRLSLLRGRPSSEAQEFYQKGTEQLHAGAYFAATKELVRACRLAPEHTMAHARLAAAWLGMELPERAAREMLLARRSQGSSLTGGERLYVDALDLTLTQDFERAAQKFETILRRNGDLDTAAHLDLGSAYERAQHPISARAEYLRAVQLRPTEAAAWLRLAILSSQAAQWKQGDEGFAKADELYQTTSNLEGLTEVAYQRGVASYRKGRVQDADAFLKHALRNAQMAGNFHQEIRTKLALSTNAYLAGDAAVAEQYAREAVDIARLNQMGSLATRGLLNLGHALSRSNRFAEAERYYRDGLVLAQSSGSRRLEAFSLLSLSSLHHQSGKPEQAAEEAARALAFFQRNNFTRESSQSLVLMGRAQRDLGDFRAALDSFSRAAAVSEKAKDSALTALAEESMGSLENERQDYPKALTHYQESLRLSGEGEQAGYAALQSGQILWVLGRYAESQTMFAHAHRVAGSFPKLRLELLRSEAEMALSQGRFREAERGCRRALEATGRNPVETADLERLLGLIQAGAGSRVQGVRSSTAALELASETRNPASRAAAALGLLQTRAAVGDWNGVLALWDQQQESLARFPEWHWKALAMVAAAHRALSHGVEAQRWARDADQELEQLRQQWGAPAFEMYLTRRDIGKFRRMVRDTLSRAE